MKRMPKFNVDDIDLKIAEALRENARLSYKKLGEMVSLSTASAYERTKKMEENQVILDYRTDVDYGKFGYAIHSFILLKDDKVYREAPTYLNNLEYVHNCWVIGGEYDYMIEVYMESNAALSYFLEELYDKIGRTYTLFIIRDARYHPYAKPL